MTIHSEDLREKVARAIKANRFVRTGRESSIEQMDAPTENELDDARVAVETVLSLLSSIKEGDADRLKEAERALEPFAREADEWGVTWSDAHRPEQDEARATFTVGDLRRARQALSFIRQGA